MAFIAKNPIAAPKSVTMPPTPMESTRGMFPMDDGWYDINDDGVCTKIYTYDDLDKMIVDIKTLPNGSTAIVEKSVDDNKIMHLTFSIPKGEKGATGAQGYTPIRGTDYWTDGDKQEIVSNTKESIKPDISAALTQAKTYTDASSALSIKSVSYNADTAVFTFTRGDGTDIVIDLPIEATVKNGYYDPEKKELSLVLVNNQEIRIPASGLIADYDGSTTGTIQCSVSADNIISCKIVSGSVSKTLLTEALQAEIDQKADRAQTLSGYGIADAYTKAEVDAKTAYASQSQKGTVRMWVSYDGDEAVLNILTEDSENEA